MLSSDAMLCGKDLHVPHTLGGVIGGINYRVERGKDIMFLFACGLRSLAAGTALLLLTSGAQAAIIAQFSIVPSPLAPNQTASFNHSSSSETDLARTLILFEYDFTNDGVYDASTASRATSVTHAYATFGSYTAKLRVTNDLGQSATTTQTVSVNQGNLAPVAQPGGPYSVTSGSTLSLDGSGSSDPNVPAGDFIASYAWDLNNDGTFETSGVSPSITFATLVSMGLGNTGVLRPLSLRVTDSFGLTNTSATTFQVVAAPEPGSLTLLAGGALVLLRRGRRGNSNGPAIKSATPPF